MPWIIKYIFIIARGYIARDSQFEHTLDEASNKISNRTGIAPLAMAVSPLMWIVLGAPAISWRCLGRSNLKAPSMATRRKSRLYVCSL